MKSPAGMVATIDAPDRSAGLLASRPRLNLSLFAHAGISVLTVAAGGMLFRALTSRTIGPAETGLLAFALTIVSLASSTISLGIPIAIVKFVAAQTQPEARAAYLQAGFRLMVIHSILGGIALWACLPMIGMWWDKPHISAWRFEIAVCAVLWSFISFWERAFNGLFDMRSTAAVNLTNNASRLLLVLLCIPLGLLSASYAFRAVILGAMLANLWGVRLIVGLRRRYGSQSESMRGCAPSLYQFGVPQFGAILLDQITYNTGVLFNAYYLSDADVGCYANAVLLASLLWLGPSALQMLTYPLMSEAWSRKDSAQLGTIIGFSVRLAATVITPMAMGLYVLRDDIILLIFGSKFLAAGAPLAVLILGYWFNAVISRPLGASMGALDRPRLDMLRVAVAAGSNIIASWLLVPTYGIVGAAWAMTASLVITSIISQTLIVRLSGTSFSRQTARAILLVIPAAAIMLIPIQSPILRISVAVAGALMLLAIGWFHVLSTEDRSLILGRFRKDAR